MSHKPGVYGVAESEPMVPLFGYALVGEGALATA
jgi:hypothetical protein